MKADLKDAESYYVSCGIFDSYLRRNVNEQVYEELQAIDANVAFTWKNGSHDWAVWRAQLSDFAKNYLGKPMHLQATRPLFRQVTLYRQCHLS